MNSLQILQSLQNIKNHTVGVYPADRIPKVWTRPTAFVINTDGYKLPGAHWVAMYVDRDGHGWFFDSYGLPPIVPQHLARLRKNCRLFRYNATQFQGPASQCCGQYCVMFLHYMSTGFGIHNFKSVFSDNLQRNDKIVEEYYNAYIDKCNKSRAKDVVPDTGACVGGGYKNKFLQCIQCCCSRQRWWLGNKRLKDIFYWFIPIPYTTQATEYLRFRARAILLTSRLRSIFIP